MKMKWNWGNSIALYLGLFIATIGFLLYLSLQQRNDLVTTDYYAKELAYQSEIDRQVRTRDLGLSARLEWSQEHLWLRLPESLHGQKGDLRLEMYCQNDERKDFSLRWEATEIQDLRLPSEKLSQGKWIAKVHLDTEGDALYFAPQIILP